LLNEGVDQIRREEQQDSPELKRTRYIWLKNRGHLRADQIEKLEALLRPSSMARKTARAYRLKVAFQEFWDLPPNLADTYLKRWYFWATHSRLPAMIRVARTIKEELGRRAALVSLAYQQRDARSDEQPPASCEGQSARLSNRRESHRDGLPRLRQTRLQSTHLK